MKSNAAYGLRFLHLDIVITLAISFFWIKMQNIFKIFIGGSYDQTKRADETFV